MTDPYLLWKTAHIVSGAVVFGTGVGIAFFCWFGYRAAMRSCEIEGLRAVLKLTVMADFCFTAPAVLFQFVSGLWLMQHLGWSLTSPWAVATFVLFGLTGICWLPVVVLQIRLYRATLRAPTAASLNPDFHRAFQCWFVLGIPAFAAVLVLYYLMVAKPLLVVSGV